MSPSGGSVWSGSSTGRSQAGGYIPWSRRSGRYRACTHLSLDKDAPHGRPIERPELGRIIPIREVGGLHDRYIRRVA